MPGNWKTYKFSELFETASGLSKSRDQFGFGSPFLTFKDVFYNYFLPPELGDLANTSEKEQKRGSVKRGDIFLTRTSETLHELGMSSVALKDYPNSTFNGFCKRLRQKKGSTVKIHPEFIGYFLRSNSFRNEVSSHATMTTRASLNNTSISSLSVTLPPFAEQVEISKILKPLDDKIELNLQMNKTLEEMAMALYKHWFVDFGPFQDGEFEDSELGEIPKGWEVKKLPEIAKNHNKKRKPLSTRERAKRQGIYPYYGATKILDYIDEFKFDGEFILLAEDGTVKTERDTPYLQFVEGKFWVSNHAHVLTGNGEYSNEFLYLCLNNKNVVPIITGAVQLKINKQNLESLEFLVPPKEILENFEEIIIPQFKYQKILSKENQDLIELRDTLLPKLISGEVRVKDVEKTLTEVL